MSHFSRIKTSVRDRELLVRCLSDMGYTVHDGGLIKGHQGQQEVDFAVTTGGGYGIGFVADGQGAYDMVGDWWGVSGRDRRAMEEVKERVAGIQKEYAVRTVLEQTQNQGFSVVEKTEEQDGSVRIVVRRWV